MQSFSFRQIDESQEYCTHLTHDLMLLVETNLVVFVADDHFLFFLKLVYLYLLEDINGILFLLGLKEHSTGYDAVQKVLEMFVGLGCPAEEVFLELFVEVIGVIFVYFHGGEGELSAVDECALEAIVMGEVVEGHASLFEAFVHEGFESH